jgi:hypothetical protein
MTQILLIGHREEVQVQDDVVFETEFCQTKHPTITHRTKQLYQYGR